MGGAQDHVVETEAGSSCWQHRRWEDAQQQQQQQQHSHNHNHNHQQYQQHFSQPAPIPPAVIPAPPPPQHHHIQLQNVQQQQQQYHFHSRTGVMPTRRIYSYPVPGDPMITSSLKGKQGKDVPEEKKDDGELWGNVEAQAAFLGPNLWDKTLPYDADLKVLNHYVDLDEFLSENGIPVDGVAGGGQGPMPGGQLHKMNSDAGGHQGPAGLHLEVTKRERSPSPSECCSPDTLNPPSPADSTEDHSSSPIQFGLSLVALSMASSGRDFDPRTRAFSDEELKPQPMIKKSRKQFVPDDLKDDKYWARRRKNNMAAKRSRDARRMKENQIALRAGFLEKENMGLRQELDRLKNENILLRDKLSKYTDV
ncbi:hepatic leukemia factor isoform X5 [Athalia rosae]|uniref:hepatic leukemia factor isoform X5 n=1 Tax=Athalia rosae TaxID=37344 RepID=UPI00203475B4|nr:hepatic leukemia factor isoform X5 [Athalia rosae]